MTGYPPASISAQLRHLRKTRHGGYRLKKRCRLSAKVAAGVDQPQRMGRCGSTDSIGGEASLALRGRELCGAARRRSRRCQRRSQSFPARFVCSFNARVFAAGGAMSVKPELAFDVCWEVYRGALEVLETKRGVCALNWQDSSRFLWRPDIRPRLNEWVADFALAGQAALDGPEHASRMRTSTI
jgi:hypothetical protein